MPRTTAGAGKEGYFSRTWVRLAASLERGRIRCWHQWPGRLEREGGHSEGGDEASGHHGCIMALVFGLFAKAVHGAG